MDIPFGNDLEEGGLKDEKLGKEWGENEASEQMPPHAEQAHENVHRTAD